MDGDSGRGTRFGTNYNFNINPNNTVYINYDTETVGGKSDRIALGHRSKLTNKLDVYQEHRFNNNGDVSDRGAKSYGLDYKATDNWNIGFEAFVGEKDNTDGSVDERNAYSVSSRYKGNGYDFVNKLEYLIDEDSGRKNEQWLTANHFNISLSDETSAQ